MSAAGQHRHPISLFGASTPSGAAFRELAGDHHLVVLGRRCPPGWPLPRFMACDLTSAPAADLPLRGWIVSFAPLWHLAPFLAERLRMLQQSGVQRDAFPEAVVACSSSSVLTKRFAANREDQALVKRLLEAESQLSEACRLAAVPCRILRPTLIYGAAGGFADRNLSVLRRLMGRLPLLPVPAHSGLRQPIHARQLAGVALQLLAQPDQPSDPLDVGGDEILSYRAMLQRLREVAARQPGDPAGRCRLVPLPAPLFHLLAAPLLPFRPKLFEAVLRIEADLAGFTPAHTLLREPPQRFPLEPLAPR